MRTTAVCTVRVREEEYAALARLTAEVARVTRALFHRMYQLDQPVEARDALRGVMAEGVVLKRHANSALLEAQGLARAWKERLTSERARLDERIRILEAVLAQDAERAAADEPPRGAWRRARDRRALYRARIRLGRVQRALAGRPTHCFGGRKLRRSGQLRAWRERRDASCLLAGEAGKAGGNEIATWNGDGMLRIRLLRTEEVTHLTLAGVRLPKRYLLAAHTALAYRQPLSWRVTLLPGLRVKLALSFEEWEPRITSRIEHGAIALDLNADHAAIIDVTGDGRPGRATRLPVGEGPQSTLDIAHAVAERARERQCPVVIEDLDFRRKKSWLKRYGKPFARILSGFKSAEVAEAIERACARAGVEVIRVDPAYTSQLGKLVYPARRRLGAHHAAALVIGRRGLGYAERLPRGVACRPRPTEVSGRGSGGRRIRCLQWLAAVQPRRRSARRRAATAAPGPPRARAGPAHPIGGRRSAQSNLSAVGGAHPRRGEP